MISVRTLVALDLADVSEGWRLTRSTVSISPVDRQIGISIGCDTNEIIQSISIHIDEMNTTRVAVEVRVNVVDLGEVGLSICRVGP